MAEESTNTTTPAVPDWAQDIRYARSMADEFLLPAERDLLDAALLLLRARHGRCTLDRPKETARYLVRCALAKLDEQAQS